ncbi:MAG: YbgC/FadM family acyl-CoA thioesterase [Thiotrichales bacterium]|nr:YbgC/FadM family acyl-CoA thioesterase [Thiotrichales bacterium]
MNDCTTTHACAAAAAAVTTCRVIFGDTDAGGVVYHPRYLEMAERGRNEFMRAAGLDVGNLFEHRRLSLALRSADMTFHVPAQFDDRLTVRTGVERLGAASSRWVSRIRRGGTLVCTVRAEIVCMDRFSRRPILYPDDLRCVFEQMRSRASARGQEASR